MKLLTKTLVLTIALLFTASAFAQSATTPTNVTRPRKATTDGAPRTASEVKPANDSAVTTDATVDKDKSKTSSPSSAVTADAGPFSEPTPATITPASQKGDQSKSKDPSKTLAEVTADGQTNRRDQSSEEEAIVPYYNNFFTTYRLGPEDVISVTVFGQDRYSKSGITIGPSGRISLALIPDGIFVNGKTVAQVAELIKKRYDEYNRSAGVGFSRPRGLVSLQRDR